MFTINRMTKNAMHCSWHIGGHPEFSFHPAAGNQGPSSSSAWDLPPVKGNPLASCSGLRGDMEMSIKLAVAQTRTKQNKTKIWSHFKP